MYTKTRGVRINFAIPVICVYCNKTIHTHGVEVRSIILCHSSTEYYHFNCYTKSKEYRQPVISR